MEMLDEWDSGKSSDVKPTWPEGTEPTAAEWQAWFTELPTEQAVRVAAQVLTQAENGMACVQHDHVGKIGQLRSEIDRLTEDMNLSKPQRPDVEHVVLMSPSRILFLTAEDSDGGVSGCTDRELAVLSGLLKLATERVVREQMDRAVRARGKA